MGFKSILLYTITNIIFTIYILYLSLGFTKEKLPQREVVLFWGQNTARLPEKNLDFFCNLQKYNTIVVSYATEFFASTTSKSILFSNLFLIKEKFKLSKR